MWLGSGISIAREVDVLIKVLKKKGILTESEAEEVLKEVQMEKEKNEDAVKEVEPGGPALEIPDWIKKMKLKGDVRLRYRDSERETVPEVFENRYKVRLRLGVETEVNDQWKAGFGLASGGADPRSTNWTLEDTFEKIDIRIDYAYAQYQPFEWGKLVAGKFKNPIWKTKDLMWDGDITPDGIVAMLEHKPMDNLELFLVPGWYLLNESSDTEDGAGLIFAQPGLKWKFMDKAYLKFAGTVYDFQGVAGNNFDEWGSGSNSKDANNRLFYDYDSIALDAEVGFPKIPGPVPFFAVFGQFVSSDADSDLDGDGFEDNEGYLVGVKFGHKKVKKLWQWQGKYNYRRLERDAWPDFLPDSDFYDGATNAKGHEVEFQLGLQKNVDLKLDYYSSELIRHAPGGTAEPEDLLQIDLNVKW
jgi:hypothetical protein